jgi:hypothetical protein
MAKQVMVARQLVGVVCQSSRWHTIWQITWEWCAKYSVGTPLGRALGARERSARKNLLGIGHWLC